jgi:hypothetical protein
MLLYILPSVRITPRVMWFFESLLSWLSPPTGHVVIGSLLDFQIYKVMELWVMGLRGLLFKDNGVIEI